MMPRAKTRKRRWLIFAAIGVPAVLVVNPAILCENAIRIPSRFRYAPQRELADAVAHDTGAQWQDAEIKAEDGARLSAWWFTPAHPKGAVLLLHGIADTRRGMLGHARFLLENGYAVLVPDSRGHGASGGETISYGLKETGDIHRWADWICARGISPLYGLGGSMGAANLLQSLRVEPRFRAVVAEGSFVSFKEIAYDRLYQYARMGRMMAFPFVENAFLYARLLRGIDFRLASPAEAVRNAKVPILLIHGTGDTNVAPRHSRELHALNPAYTQLWELPGAKHVSGLRAAPALYVPRVLAWFQNAGPPKRTLSAYPGTTPKLDGVIAPGEWDDATTFTGVADWIPQFSPTTDPKDLSLRGWVKHDSKRLYFAFDITDDVLYGIDTPRWLPDENPKAHELTREGFPWFGDEMELLINATNRWVGEENAAGNGSSWQMVCNLTKSRKGGINVGGLLEGEPRRDPRAWKTYQRWILTGAQEAVAKVKPRGKGYIIEWAVNFDPCLEVEQGKFYSTAMGDRAMGLNIALGDLDEKERGAGNFGHFHHEDWWSGAKNVRTRLRHWGTLWMRTGRR